MIPRKRRVGRPKMHRTNDAMTQAYDKLVHEYNFPYVRRQNNYIKIQEASDLYNMAQNREQWKDMIVYHKDETKRKYDKHDTFPAG